MREIQTERGGEKNRRREGERNTERERGREREREINQLHRERDRELRYRLYALIQSNNVIYLGTGTDHHLN